MAYPHRILNTDMIYELPLCNMMAGIVRYIKSHHFISAHSNVNVISTTVPPVLFSSPGQLRIYRVK